MIPKGPNHTIILVCVCGGGKQVIYKNMNEIFPIHAYKTLYISTNLGFCWGKVIYSAWGRIKESNGVIFLVHV